MSAPASWSRAITKGISTRPEKPTDPSRRSRHASARAAHRMAWPAPISAVASARTSRSVRDAAPTLLSPLRDGKELVPQQPIMQVLWCDHVEEDVGMLAEVRIVIVEIVVQRSQLRDDRSHLAYAKPELLEVAGKGAGVEERDGRGAVERRRALPHGPHGETAGVGHQNKQRAAGLQQSRNRGHERIGIGQVVQDLPERYRRKASRRVGIGGEDGISHWQPERARVRHSARIQLYTFDRPTARPRELQEVPDATPDVEQPTPRHDALEQIDSHAELLLV